MKMQTSQRRNGRAGRLVVLCMVVAACLSPAALPGDAAAAASKNAIGVCAGVPQTLALTYERSLSPNLAVRIHAGSVVIWSSAGARLQWGTTGDGIKPYLFAGVAALHARAEDYGDPEGTTTYLWLGPGASFNADRWSFFAEVSALLGGNDDKGLGDDWVFPFSPAIAGGIMFHM